MTNIPAFIIGFNRGCWFDGSCCVVIVIVIIITDIIVIFHIGMKVVNVSRQRTSNQAPVTHRTCYDLQSFNKQGLKICITKLDNYSRKKVLVLG